jgi:thymidylate synthase (FAD)
MKIIEPSYKIISPIDGEAALKFIEDVGRTCYQSFDRTTEDSARKFVKFLIQRGHESVLEHYTFSVRFIVDRAVANEIVRHRIASYAQESTRYVGYDKEKFGSEITVIKPCFFDPLTPQWDAWATACEKSEDMYMTMRQYYDVTPEQARDILPLSTKTELVMTANIRSWRNFFKLRTARAAHPQMREISIPLLKECKARLPIFFDDIEVQDE